MLDSSFSCYSLLYLSIQLLPSLFDDYVYFMILLSQLVFGIICEENLTGIENPVFSDVELCGSY
jgi:hypothetical protein